MGNCENIAIVVIGEHATGFLSGFAANYAVSTSDEASRKLYDILHECDLLGVRSIVVLMPPDKPEWRAVRDRSTAATSRSTRSNDRIMTAVKR